MGPGAVTPDKRPWPRVTTTSLGTVAHLLLSGFAIDGVRLGRRGRVVFRFAPEAAPALDVPAGDE